MTEPITFEDRIAEQLRAYAAREAPVAPEAAHVEGIDHDGRAVVVGPMARHDGERGPLRAQRADGRLHEALGAPGRVVAAAHEGDARRERAIL